MPERHRQAADQHGLPLAEVAVRQVAADDRGQIDERGVEPVQRERVLAFVMQRIDQVEHQQRPHAVIAEPLPHLGEKDHRQRAWMSAGVDRQVAPRVVGEYGHRSIVG